MMDKKSKIFGFAPIITVFALVGVWYIIALSIGKAVIFPMPHAVVASMGELLCDGEFYLSLLGSLWKIAVSFAAAMALGVALAVLSASVAFFEKLFYPIVVVARATPTMSIIFLCLLWFGKTYSPIVVSLLVIFPLLYSSCLTAIKSCDAKLLEMSEVFGVKRATVVKKLYLPFVADRMFADGISVLSLNVKLIIAAEALAMSNVTLGRLIQIADENLETARLFAVTVFAVLLSVALEYALKGVRYILGRKRLWQR